VVDSLRVGGLENGVVNLINSLDGEIFRNSICCLRTSGGLQRRLRDPETKVFELNQKLKDNLFVRMRNILADEKVDIVHSNGYGTYFDSIVGAQLAGTPLTIHCIHGIYWRDMAGMKLRRRLLQRLLSLKTNRLYAVADYLREYYIDIVGVSPRRISTIYNGVDTERYRPRDERTAGEQKRRLGFSEDEVLIGTVGTLYWVKDPEALLKAAAIVLGQRDDVRFIWAGGGPLKERLETRAGELGIDGRVHYLGSRDDIPDILSALDIFVLPSLIEGLSYSILEAMAIGLPVVATDVGGNSELVCDGATGFLVPKGDPEALAGSLLRLIPGAPLRARLGREARRRVEEKFSLKNMVQKYQQMYLNGLEGASATVQDIRAGSADHDG
jgi:sugar transferase (PEP-CTERM/EpsH1 system associated)